LTNIPVWEGIKYFDIYPGIDIEFRVVGSKLIPMIYGVPDADMDMVNLRVYGANRVEVDRENLDLSTEIGEFSIPLFIEQSGINYEYSSEKNMINSDLFDIRSPIIKSNNASPNVVSSLPSNPTGLIYSTYFGGSLEDSPYRGGEIETVGDNVFIVGCTKSLNFPGRTGFVNKPNSDTEFAIFVSKLDLNGNGFEDLIFTTILDGNDDDGGYGIAIGSDEMIYISGVSYSSNFPIINGYQTTLNGGSDAIIAKLSTNNGILSYATYLGGENYEDGHAITVNNNMIYITGATSSLQFPTTEGAFQRDSDGHSTFVTKLDSSKGMDGLLYSTYIGGGEADWGYDIQVDDENSIYITGVTYSTNFPYGFLCVGF
jgi:hypothetical protein